MSGEMKGWTTAKILVATVVDWSIVDGYVNDDVQGLAVAPTQSESMSGNWWSVTHIASGRAVGPSAEGLVKAQYLAVRLAEAGDWSRDAAVIWADEPFMKTAGLIIADVMFDDDAYMYHRRPVDDGLPEHIRSRINKPRGVAHA